MKSAIVAAIACLGLSACVEGTSNTSSVIPVNTTTAAPVHLANVSGMAALLSQVRAENGRGPVTEDRRLTAAAQAYAQDLAAHDYFSHTGRDGSSFSDRARAQGYTCSRAENLAFGNMSQAQLVANWMNSSGHRANILLRDATEFGYGHAGNKFVLIMGRGC